MKLPKKTKEKKHFLFFTKEFCLTLCLLIVTRAIALASCRASCSSEINNKKEAIFSLEENKAALWCSTTIINDRHFFRVGPHCSENLFCNKNLLKKAIIKRLRIAWELQLQSSPKSGFIFGRLGGNVGEWNFRKIEFC